MTSSIISRRAFINLSTKYPRILSQKPKKSNIPNSQTDDSWPKSLQLVGYGAVALSIPYLLSVIVAESARVRSILEERTGNVGHSIVGMVRWYWGRQEDVPYFESITETDNRDDRLALRGEESPTVQSTQVDIIKRADSNVTFHLTNDEDVQSKVCLPGGTLLSDSKIVGEDMSKRFIISFDEYEEQEENSMKEDDGILRYMKEDSDGQQNSVLELKNLTSIWSSWNYFPSDVSTDARQQTGGTTTDSTQIRINELAHNVSELQNFLRDPSCTRDRDDMEVEIQEIQSELSSLKRSKRIGKLKNIFS